MVRGFTPTSHQSDTLHSRSLNLNGPCQAPAYGALNVIALMGLIGYAKSLPMEQQMSKPYLPCQVPANWTYNVITSMCHPKGLQMVKEMYLPKLVEFEFCSTIEIH